jgi:excisionase family DNA binding protein
MNQIYTVKEAAKILGFSTNTVYKYLNEGALRASRGDEDGGRFRIPHEAVEEFLNTELPIDVLDHIEEKEEVEQLKDQMYSPDQIPSLATFSTPTSLPMNVSKVLILFSLLAIIGDVILSPKISILGQIIRVGLVGVFILLTYQHVGKRPISPNNQQLQGESI